MKKEKQIKSQNGRKAKWENETKSKLTESKLFALFVLKNSFSNLYIQFSYSNLLNAMNAFRLFYKTCGGAIWQSGTLEIFFIILQFIFSLMKNSFAGFLSHLDWPTENHASLICIVQCSSNNFLPLNKFSVFFLFFSNQKKNANSINGWNGFHFGYPKLDLCSISVTTILSPGV